MLNKVKIINVLMIISLVLIIIKLNTHNIDDEESETTQKEEKVEEIIEDLILDNEINETNNEKEIISHGYYISTTIKEEETEATYYFINYENNYIPFHKKQIQYNYNKGIIIKPKYIVIHETANTAVGANANAHYRYWNRDLMPMPLRICR